MGSRNFKASRMAMLVDEAQTLFAAISEMSDAADDHSGAEPCSVRPRCSGGKGSASHGANP